MAELTINSKKIVKNAWAKVVSDGYAEPFQTIGTGLSIDGALSSLITREVFRHRKSGNEKSIEISRKYFKERLENLKNTRALLQKTIKVFEDFELWNKIDDIFTKIEVDDIIEALTPDYGIHLFPAVIKSDEYNANYIKKYGIKGFYEMTDGYLARIELIASISYEKFEEEIKNRKVLPYWLKRMDLVGIEVPIHCDTCSINISILIYSKILEGDKFFIKSYAEAIKTLI